MSKIKQKQLLQYLIGKSHHKLCSQGDSMGVRLTLNCERQDSLNKKSTRIEIQEFKERKGLDGKAYIQIQQTMTDWLIWKEGKEESCETIP